MSTKIQSGNNTAGLVNVDSNYQLKVSLETDASNNPSNISGIKLFSENDDGSKTGTPYIVSPEADDDFRLRTASDIMLDNETFNYTAQNTGKHTYVSTTLANSWSTAGLTTNSGNVTTTNIGSTFGTYAEFPIYSSASLYCECSGGFSNQPVSNAIIDFGMFRRGTANPFTPIDGVYFRLNSAGLFGVVTSNGTENTTSLFDFVYVNNKKYQFIITVTEREVKFWIDNILYASIETPTGLGQPFMSTTLPFSIRHANIGAAGGIINFVLNEYAVALGGPQFIRTLGEAGNAIFGSYQGLSGGTMGGLTVYTNSTNPTAAVPANTALTANLPNGLGGQAWETVTTALNTDVILMSYQVPVGSVSTQGKRLKIRGIKLSGFIQTVIVGGPWINTYALAFGHTAVSLATAEAATTKKPRIILLPELTNATTANQAVSTMLSTNGDRASYFEEPIYVNPGEFVQLIMKRHGTIGTSGVVAYNIQYDYSWE